MSRVFDPLTYRCPRTLAELDDSPFAWLQTGEETTHGEELLIAERLGIQAPPRPWARDLAAAFVLGLVSLAALAGLVAWGWGQP